MSAMRAATVAIAAVLVTACTRRPDVATADEASPTPTAASNAASNATSDANDDARVAWPDSRPAHLRVLFTRRTLPIGKPLVRDAIDLHVVGDACDPTYPCKAMSDPEADALWAKLVKEDFAAMQAATRVPTSPHVSHADVRVEWDGARIEVVDGFRIADGSPERKAFDRVVDAILALAPPP